MPTSPVLCVIETISPDFLGVIQEPTIFNMRAVFNASCLDADDHLVAYQVDEDGIPTAYSFSGTVTVDSDDTQSTLRSKMASAALAGFANPTVPGPLGVGSVPIPVLFL